MNEENNKVPSQDKDITTDPSLTTENIDNKQNIEANNGEAENKAQASGNTHQVEDISKVKIRTVLKHRIKNWRPSVRRAIAYLLVGIIFFAAGFGVDRAIMKHRGFKGNNARPGITRKLQGGKVFGKQFKNKNGQLPGKKAPDAKPNLKNQ